MLLQRQHRNIILFLLTLLLAGSTPVQMAAQDPGSAPQSKPASQEKGDPSKKTGSAKKPENEQRNPLDQIQMQILKGVQSAKLSNGQGTQQDDQLEAFSNESIKIDTELVQLDVTVIDQFNNPIFGLSKDDFTIYENKVKQNLESVSAEEIPISFGVIVDTSGSMRERLQTVSDAALSLIKQKRQDDETFVAQFKTEYEMIQEFTTDESDLEWAVGQFFSTGGTSLLDAIINSSAYADKKGKRRRKAIVVISDGLEANSSAKEKEVIEAIKENEVQLYMIGFMKQEELSTAFGKTPAMKAQDLLSRLAEDSGGRAFFPKDLKEIPAIAAQIAKDLRTQYVVSYYPTNEKKDSTYRALRVDIAPKPGQRLIARARQGYFANGEGDKEAKQTEINK